jgi:signal transduction histidine kinase
VERATGVAGPRSLRGLFDAVVAISAGLDLPTTLRRIVEVAASLADAQYAALGVLDEGRTLLAQFITVGIDDETRAEIGELPKGHGILGVLIADPRPLRLPDLREHPDTFGFPPGHPPMRSFLGVPIAVRGEVFGNLYLTDKRSQEVFSDVDEELVVALAAAAGVAIDNARLHERVRDLALVEDRERIAMDLHDTVIQQLFAIGLSMEATARRAQDREIESRLQAAVEGLDATIKRIRSTIFTLSAARSPGGVPVRERILALVAEAEASLPNRPRVVFDGPVEAVLPPSATEDLVAVTQELLSNVLRHADAKSVDVLLAVAADGVVLRVEDDGVGIAEGSASGSSLGLHNLANRAERLGGSFTLSGREGGGTRAEWWVPADRTSITEY